MKSIESNLELDSSLEISGNYKKGSFSFKAFGKVCWYIITCLFIIIAIPIVIMIGILTKHPKESIEILKKLIDLPKISK